MITRRQHSPFINGYPTVALPAETLGTPEGQKAHQQELTISGSPDSTVATRGFLPCEEETTRKRADSWYLQQFNFQIAALSRLATGGDPLEGAEDDLMSANTGRSIDEELEFLHSLDVVPDYTNEPPGTLDQAGNPPLSFATTANEPPSSSRTAPAVASRATTPTHLFNNYYIEDSRRVSEFQLRNLTPPSRSQDRPCFSPSPLAGDQVISKPFATSPLAPSRRGR